MLKLKVASAEADKS